MTIITISMQNHALDSDTIGLSSYIAHEVARLLKAAPLNVNRWLRGYTCKRHDVVRQVTPLWEAQHANVEEHLEIDFRDLIELRLVKAFLDAEGRLACHSQLP